MTTSTLRSALLWLLPAMAVCTLNTTEPMVCQDQSAPEAQGSKKEKAIQVQYLEIVTPDVDAMCGTLEKLHGVKFSRPEAELGNARTAALEGGGLIGVRAPMREDEEPVVRPYLLVDDIESAVEAARAAGGEIAMPPTEIPKGGKFAIYIHGGIQHGLWQI
jgi:predicted enzyme related to lactoylglutathione lyase